MVLMTLDDGAPLYFQIAQKLRQEIHEGHLAVGDKVPASRILADNLGVSRNTVLNALDQLKAEGYLETRRGAGTFVAAGRLPAAAATDAASESASAAPRDLSEYAKRCLAIPYADTDRVPDADFDFSYGRNLLGGTPLGNWLHCRGTAADLCADYTGAFGLVGLRREIARHLYQQRGLYVSEDHIVVTSGTQQSLDLLTRTLLDPGDTVMMENPHYESARLVFQSAGALIETIPVDGGGLITDDLPKTTKAKILYVTPSHQFPTGAILSVRRRLEIIEWARQHGVYVLEDDYDSEFRYDVNPLQPMIALSAGDSVAYCGTFSKSLLPGLRLGYLIVPTALLAPIKMAKLLADRGSNKVVQHQLESLLATGRYSRHVHRVARRYKTARQRLIRELDSQFGEDIEIQGTNAGAHLLVHFKKLPASEIAALLEGAASEGLAVYSASHCYYGSAPPHPELLFGYSAIEPDCIPEAINRLARCYRGIVASS